MNISKILTLSRSIDFSITNKRLWITGRRLLFISLPFAKYVITKFADNLESNHIPEITVVLFIQRPNLLLAEITVIQLETKFD